jgi:enediyne biosynthesis protein E5
MITDPGTTPARPRDQMVFGGVTALVYGALVLVHVSFGLFFALTIVCAGRLVLTWGRHLWRSMRPVAVPAEASAAEPAEPAELATAGAARRA